MWPTPRFVHTREKPSEKGEDQQRTESTQRQNSDRTKATSVEGERSHHYSILVPLILARLKRRARFHCGIFQKAYRSLAYLYTNNEENYILFLFFIALIDCYLDTVFAHPGISHTRRNDWVKYETLYYELWFRRYFPLYCSSHNETPTRALITW